MSRQAHTAWALFAYSVAALLTGAPCWSDSAADQPQQPSVPLPASAPSGLSRWFNPETAPFIPVPEIAVNPNNGTTIGLIPTWIQTDDNHDIRRIIAPDVLYNQHFGYGVHGRVFGYDSEDEQWSLVGGIKERVEREFDAEYQTGRAHEALWSFSTSLIYDVDGTPRFYGIGNESPESSETNYTNQQELAQIQVGLNLSHLWQLQYTGRFKDVNVLPGTLAGIPSTDIFFGPIPGVGTNRQLLNRLAIVYDSRNDLTVPSKGWNLVAYTGLASSNGAFNDSMYSEAGFDGRAFWSLASQTILAAHMALRYLPTAHDVPFWALSSLGGGESVVGGEQPLRGFGEGRFYDRDSFSSTLELRQKVMSIKAVSTSVDLEFTPFIDVGRVFSRTSTMPFDQLHTVCGVGFRGIARPFVVGYVDIGYGSEGPAVFTGLNYPF